MGKGNKGSRRPRLVRGPEQLRQEARKAAEAKRILAGMSDDVGPDGARQGLAAAVIGAIGDQFHRLGATLVVLSWERGNPSNGEVQLVNGETAQEVANMLHAQAHRIEAELDEADPSGEAITPEAS